MPATRTGTCARDTYFSVPRCVWGFAGDAETVAGCSGCWRVYSARYISSCGWKGKGVGGNGLLRNSEMQDFSCVFM